MCSECNKLRTRLHNRDVTIEAFTKAASLFIEKVETNRAHSVETYGQLKSCIELSKAFRAFEKLMEELNA